MRFIYIIILRFYVLGIRLAANFSEKARLWIMGRKNVFRELEAAMLKRGNRPLVWIHAASLGEFEQGRPLIEALKAAYPEVYILLTFFSPSGYEVRKDYALADFVSYLPMDGPANARQFLSLTNPNLAIFIKYELWYYYLTTLKQKEIPTLLISALFRADQFFFRWYGRWFLPAIAGIDHLFVQNEPSKQCLLKYGIHRVSVAGDSRVDRVAALAASTAGTSADVKDQRINTTLLKQFTEDYPVFIAGSTWPEDEAVLAPFFNKQGGKWKIILAPHEIEESRLTFIEKLFKLKTVRYSQGDTADLQHAELLIIDNIGMLAQLYQFGKLAYVGGAFGKGLHNTLEPIAYGIPVIFGPRFQKFEEARWLVQNGGGFVVDSAGSFEQQMIALQDTDFYRSSAKTAKQYIEENRGATALIMNFIEKCYSLRSIK
jgi:3-deoxy-D-manno-octulosonic-acid transferase